MKRLKIVIYVLMLTAIQSRAQDPNFSQFFSSPLNVNPALTANINAAIAATAPNAPMARERKAGFVFMGDPFESGPGCGSLGLPTRQMIKMFIYFVKARPL